MSTATNPTSSGCEFKGCKFKTVRFYTTKYVLNLTRSLSQMLLRELKLLTADIVCDTPITSEIVQRNRTNPTELLFILIPQLLVTDASALPEPGKYCIYQLEQLNDKMHDNTVIKTTFNPILTSLIRNSVAAFDYSSVNLDYYPKSLRSKITVLPPPIRITQPPAIPETHRSDILFYGSMNPRRERILTRLAETLGQRGHNYNIQVLTRAFGDELIHYISSARIVLNIHFYANSILETDRIHTALQFNGVTVISEYPTQRDAFLPIYESNPRMRFCEEISCDNIAELADACINVLSLQVSGSDEHVFKLNALCSTALTILKQHIWK